MIGGIRAALLADIGVFARRTTVGFVVLVTFPLGVVWALVNFHNSYSLVQTRVEDAVARLARLRAASGGATSAR